MAGYVTPEPNKRDAETLGNRVNIARSLYKTMLRIRHFEESVASLFANNQLPGFVHLSIGQEAVAAGACLALRPDDVIATTHRGHGHVLAKGADPRRMMAELFGNREGYSKGVAGSMHIADLQKGILGANAIVGASILIATGAAYSSQVLGASRVGMAFFGDGATSEGAFHEALNLASLWRLPVIYVCENNGYGEMTPESVHRAGVPIAERARSYGMHAVEVDGTDAVSVYDAVSQAAAQCRAGSGPVLIEARTNRWHGHFEGDPQRYRAEEELRVIRLRDPIKLLSDRLLSEQWADSGWLENVEADTEEEIESAVQFGASGSRLDCQELLGLLHHRTGTST